MESSIQPANKPPVAAAASTINGLNGASSTLNRINTSTPTPMPTQLPPSLNLPANINRALFKPPPNLTSALQPPSALPTLPTLRGPSTTPLNPLTTLPAYRPPLLTQSTRSTTPTTSTNPTPQPQQQQPHVGSQLIAQTPSSLQQQQEPNAMTNTTSSYQTTFPTPPALFSMPQAPRATAPPQTQFNGMPPQQLPIQPQSQQQQQAPPPIFAPQSQPQPQFYSTQPPQQQLNQAPPTQPQQLIQNYQSGPPIAPMVPPLTSHNLNSSTDSTNTTNSNESSENIYTSTAQHYNPISSHSSSGYQPPRPLAQNFTNYQQNYPSMMPPAPPLNPSAPPSAPPTTTTTQQPRSNISQNRYPTLPPEKAQVPQFQQPIPQQQQVQQPPQNSYLLNQMGNMSLNTQKSHSKPVAVDLLNEKKLIQPWDDETDVPRPKFPHEFYTNVNCSPDIIRCTVNAIPESKSLLDKCRLPLGILIHPFKDLESLKVIQLSNIVRCRTCRSYINPFVHFLDNTKWRCNLCYSINDLPDEFLFDPVTKTYGDPSKRPEINSSTIEFIAPAEYTLRPPPPSMYLFVFDVSHNAINTGFLKNTCEILIENLEKLPGDTRTMIGFLTFNSTIHFYNLSDAYSKPYMMIYTDIEDVTLPLPENLMVNLYENRDKIKSFLETLPESFQNTYDTDSALGVALTAAHKMLSQTGGRITVMQSLLPNVGMGSLKAPEKEPNINPQTDFYKKLALDCANNHIAVDLFMFNSLYADLASLSCISKYSGGDLKYYPDYDAEAHPEQVERFSFDFRRYLTRKIGFEAVMRVRCTRGMSIHTFHGNFFVRSTDLLALPNVNPDAGFGMQVSIDEPLTDTATVCFQTALLYTSSKGERRIRIHTFCLPVSNSATEIINGADQEAILGLVSKMAVDRSLASSIKEAKDAMVMVAADYLSAYAQILTSGSKSATLLSPYALRMVPLYMLAMIKSMGFKNGNVKIDDRVYAMSVYKSMPLKYLMLMIHPNLYAVHNIDDRKVIMDTDVEICIPPKLQLSSESIDRHGVYILDNCETIYMWVGRSVHDQFLQDVFGVKTFNELPDHMYELPELENILSERIRNFIMYLYDQRPFGTSFICLREDSKKRALFFQNFHEDKTESSLSYHEFIRHILDQVKK